jgi:hypothetical protein
VAQNFTKKSLSLYAYSASRFTPYTAKHGHTHAVLSSATPHALTRVRDRTYARVADAAARRHNAARLLAKIGARTCPKSHARCRCLVSSLRMRTRTPATITSRATSLDAGAWKSGASLG